MQEIIPQALKDKIDQEEEIMIVDVREPYEFDICNIGGHLIPMGEIMNNLDKIPKDKPVVVHCRSGKRSAAVIDALEQMHGYKNLINLKGGILAYADKVDSSLTRY